MNHARQQARTHRYAPERATPAPLPVRAKRGRLAETAAWGRLVRREPGDVVAVGVVQLVPFAVVASGSFAIHRRGGTP
jgi:hypothetical protein